MSEKEWRVGLSSVKVSHPLGFKASESRSTNNVLLPSAESLPPKEGKDIKILTDKHMLASKNIQD